jgi:protein-disulfide isomerase
MVCNPASTRWWKTFSPAFVVAFYLPATALCQEAVSSPVEGQVATVNGAVISELDLLQLAAGQLQRLRQQEYEVKAKVLDQLIATRLLQAEAAKQGITVIELTDLELQTKVTDPTAGEVEAYYLAQKDKLQRPLSDVLVQLRQALRQAKIQQAMEQYVSRLKADAKIQISLSPPRVQVADNPKRARGNANAAVSIVEFSDYHCPFCKRAESVVQEVMAKYDGRVRLVYRDFPLDNLHPRARAAAEAASCAGDQGKFWEYHDLLLAHAPKASDDDLKGFATTLVLDMEKFNGCIFQNTHRDAVQRDIDEGTKLGISGTPAFFINGRFLNGAQPLEKFIQIIDDELARAQSNNAVSMRKP